MEDYCFVVCKLLRRLRGFYHDRPLPAVALTGRGDDGWVEDCRRSGYGEFLMKPVTFEQVLAAVKAVRTTPFGPSSPRKTADGIQASVPVE